MVQAPKRVPFFFSRVTEQLSWSFDQDREGSGGPTGLHGGSGKTQIQPTPSGVPPGFRWFLFPGGSFGVDRPKFPLVWVVHGCCWETFNTSLLIAVEWLKSNHLTAKVSMSPLPASTQRLVSAGFCFSLKALGSIWPKYALGFGGSGSVGDTCAYFF